MPYGASKGSLGPQMWQGHLISSMSAQRPAVEKTYGA